MSSASEGPTSKHHGRVRILAVTTLLLFTASLFSSGPALAEPKTELIAQTIDFTLPESGTVGEVLALEGTASSDLPLTYEAKPPSRCTVEGTELRLLSEGKCKVEARQAGDDTYGPARMSVEIEGVAPPLEPQAQARPAPDPRAEPKPKVKAEPKLKPKVAPKSKSEPPGKAKPKAKPRAKPKAEPPGKTKTKPEPPGKAKPKAEPPGKTKTKPEPPGKAKPKAEPPGKAKTKPEPPGKAKPKAEPPGKAKTKPEPPGKAKPKAEPPGKAKPEPSVDEELLAEPVEDSGAGPGLASSGDGGSVGVTSTDSGVEATAPEPQASAETQATSDGLPILYIYPVNGGVTERDSGSVQLRFRARTEFGSFSPSVTFDWATADGSATAPSDYEAASGSLTMEGWDTADFDVTVYGDTDIEPDEFLSIEVTDVVGAVYDADFGQPYGEIWNDDPEPTIRLEGHSVTEGDDGTRSVHFQMAACGPFSFDWATVDDTATAPSDYVADSGSINLPPGFCLPGFTVTVNGDTDIEADERFKIEVSNVVGASYDEASSDPYGTIRDDDPLALTLVGGGWTEGDWGTDQLWFGAHLSRPSDVAVTFDWVTGDDTATAPSDYVAASGTITVPTGAVYAEFPVTVNGDTDPEPDERFEVLLSNVVGATFDAASSEPYGELVDDDAGSEPTLTLTFNYWDRYEGDTGTIEDYFTVRLSQPSDALVSFDYATVDDSAVAPADYVSRAGTLTIPAGQTQATLAITVSGDTDIEADERYVIVVSNVSGATYDAAASEPYGLIWDDDNDAPALEIDCRDIAETDPDMVRNEPRTTEVKCWVSISEPAEEPVTFHYATADGTAVGGDNPDQWPDYLSASGDITLLPGTTRKYFNIKVVGDRVIEDTEYFSIEISNVIGATFRVEDSDLTAEIIDDDDPTPAFYIQGYEIDEGDSGTSELRFRAGIPGNYDLPFYDITFDYETVDETAVAPSDYLAESGTITIPARTRYSEFFTIAVNGDTEVEFDEWFFLDVTAVEGAVYAPSYPWGDILNDDLPTLSVDDVTVVEGTGSDTYATFTVLLSDPAPDWVSMGLHTVDGTATDPADYLGGGDWIVLDPGYDGLLIDVPIIGDSLDEPHETFSLVVSGAMGATIVDGTGIATIIDDDLPAPPADATPPDVSAPAVDFARGRSLSKTAKPIPLNLRFAASDPSGISATRLQHRTGTGPYANVRLASASTATPSSLSVRKLGPGGVAPAAPEARPAVAPAGTGTRGTVKVGAKAKTVHRFRSQATDGAGNTSPFANAPATRVKVFQDGSRAVKRKGSWATKRARAYFGSTIKRTTRKGARVQLTARGTDFAIVATKGRDKGKARVLVDGKPVGVVDLYARKAKPRTIVHAVTFAKPGRHTIALQALGKKNPKAKGKRVELDAFLVLTP